LIVGQYDFTRTPEMFVLREPKLAGLKGVKVRVTPSNGGSLVDVKVSYNKGKTREICWQAIC
jgi:hypothetical protein